jgi:hypothetical protein
VQNDEKSQRTGSPAWTWCRVPRRCCALCKCQTGKTLPRDWFATKRLARAIDRQHVCSCCAIALTHFWFLSGPSSVTIPMLHTPPPLGPLACPAACWRRRMPSSPYSVCIPRAGGPMSALASRYRSSSLRNPQCLRWPRPPLAAKPLPICAGSTPPYLQPRPATATARSYTVMEENGNNAACSSRSSHSRRRGVGGRGAAASNCVHHARLCPGSSLAIHSEPAATGRANAANQPGRCGRQGDPHSRFSATRDDILVCPPPQAARCWVCRAGQVCGGDAWWACARSCFW